MIFYRKGNRTSTGESFNFETRINQSVFPGHQGGPTGAPAEGHRRLAELRSQAQGTY